MTTKELNRDIKKLNSEIYRMSFESNESYFKFIDEVEKKEFLRLYRADDSFKSFNRESILILLRLNLKLNFIPKHIFGLSIDLQNL